MRITHIDLRRYFALRNIRFSPHPFTVIYGDNDTGKTMLLDAILDALFGIRSRRERRFFPGFNRYDLNAEQSVEVTVEWAHGTLRVDGSNPLDSVAGLGVIESFLTLRNLLVVRESDIRFGPENEERRWWAFVRRCLSGLSGGVERVIAEVARATGVSAKGRWISKEKKEEYERLQRRLFEVSAAAEEVAALEAVSKELARLQSERKKMEEELSRVERLKKKALREKLQSELEAYRKVREELAALGAVDEGLLARWQELESATARQQEALKNLRARIEEVLTEVRGKEEQAAELMKKAAEWERYEVSLLPGVEKLLGEIRKLHRARRRHEWVRGVGRVVVVCGAGAAVVGGVLVGLGVSVWGGFGMMALGGGALATGVMAGASLARIARAMTRKKEELLSLVGTAGVGVGDTEEVERWVEAGRKEATESRARAELLLVEARGGRAKLEELNAKVEEMERELGGMAEKVSAVRDEAGVETMSELRARLERKRALEAELNARRKALAELAGSDREEDWFKLLVELEPFTKEEGEYSVEEEETLRERLKTMSEVEEELRRKGRAAEAQLAGVGVMTPVEMLVESQRLRTRIEEIEKERQTVLLTMELLQRLRRTQGMALGFVLQHAGDASSLFRKMTGNRYSRLFYRDGLLLAETADEVTLPFEHLSSGSRSLAFFAIRLALIKQIFPTPAFLLLDDPFLFCDHKRLGTVLDVLHQLVSEGWQVIYFTHDERVVEWSGQNTDVFVFNLTPPQNQ